MSPARFLGLPLASLFLYVACGESTSSPPQGNAGQGDGGVENVGGSAHGGQVPGGAGLGHAGKQTSGAGGAATAGAGGAATAGAGGAGGAAGDSAGADGEGGVGEPLPEPPNLVFVTSETYVPKSLGGLEGADKACSKLAKAAGLEGTFVAWLSTSAVDAKDRLVAASGWLNTRGSPFADQASELFEAGQVYMPVNFDENGDAVSGLVATGTTANGVVAPENCADFTSNAGDAALVTGEPTAGTALWTAQYDGSSCADEYHLYCFQIDHRAMLYPTPSQGRTVFVSSQPFVLGAKGRAIADDLCADEAAAEGFDGTFVALLPSSTESALARLVSPTRPWVRPDGMPVVGSNAGFELFPLSVAITQQANGVHVGGVPVFGAADITKKADLHCEDWTNPDAAIPAVIHGITGHTDDRWYAAATAACSEPAHVLCVEK